MKVTAHATRSQGWWAVEVPEIDGAFTQARRLDQVPAMVRDAVALLEDVPEESIEVELVPELDEALSLAIAAAELDREESERLARRASDAVALIARSLSSDEGYSLRDIGVILGVSHQRVAQIIGAKPAPQGGTSSSKASGRTRVTVRSVTSGRSGAMSKVARGRRSISKA